MADGMHGLSHKSREALAQLCSANGIRDDDLRHPERVTQIEMVLDDFNCMESLRIFTHLKSVCLIQQAIGKIQGLDACPLLERLVLNENRIEQVTGLHNCGRLRQLHLCSNAITELGDGLQGLHDLEVLWIAENALTSLRGVEYAPNIEELNASRNRLESIVGQLDRNLKVRVLNLSDNRITHFRNVLDLSKFAGLTEVDFADADWGDNPICDLSNYQMYTLYHMPALRVLDRMRITDEEHSAAQAAFARKRLYYNMRTKVSKRHASDTMRFCQGLREEHAAGVRNELEVAARSLRRVNSRQLAKDLNPAELQAMEVDESPEAGDKSSAERRLREAQAELADADVLMEALRQGLRGAEDRLMRGLRLELQTGGNVRAELGAPGKDLWARQVADLVCARFRAEDFSRFGIMDIKVHQVTRVHNRSSRIRFEGVMKVLESDGTAPNLEYLFYVPEVRNTMSHLTSFYEDGGDPCPVGAAAAVAGGGDGPADAPQDGEAPVTLVTNSVGLAEAGRLDHFSRTAHGQALARAVRRGAARRRRHSGTFASSESPRGSGGGSSFAATGGGGPRPRTDSAGSGGGVGLVTPAIASPSAAAREGDGLPSVPVVCSGSLLLCSCYLGEQHTDDPFSFDPGRDSDLRAFWLRTPSQLPHAGAAAQRAGAAEARRCGSKQVALPAFRTLCRNNAADAKQKVWQVPDPNVVLPEYLVEFDYVYSSEFVQSHIEDRRPEHGHFARQARDFAFAARVACAPSSGEGGRGEARGRDASGDEAEAGTGDAKEGSVFHTGGAAMRGRLATDEVSQDAPQVEYLDVGSLLSLQNRIVGSTDLQVLSTLKVLNLHGRGLRRLDHGIFKTLPNLEVLLLSFNCIASCSSLAASSSVTQLDLSFNLIEKVNSLECFRSLRNLDVCWNCLGLTSEVCDTDAALRDVVRTLAQDLPYLEVIDMTGNPLTASAWYRRLVLATLAPLRTLDERDITDAEVEDAKEQMGRYDGLELSENLLMERAYMRTAGIRRPAADLDSPDSEQNRIALLLGACAGCSSSSATRPTGLTRANWRGYTERLDLRDFGLADLCRFGGFSHLRRLDLSGNSLTSLLKLSPCVALEELAVERNLLKSLDGAGDLPELRRLDAGSNRVCDVLELKKLTKLSQLSLEDNLVDSLDTFASLHSLVELYLSSNLLEEVRSILLLKQLPKLLVLDLFGNDLCSSADSRPYTLFHLRRVKVLDGRPITPAEQQEAEDKFSGKVTMELLEDKLGPSPSCYNFRSVDLSNQNLRELGQLLNDDVFPSLRELSLSGNPFSDIRTVGPLSKLLVLKMNRTKIDLEKGVVAEGDQVGGIASMPHLQVLEIGQSGVADMSFFAQLPLSTLRILHLPGNEITKVEGLSHMEQLRELVLDRNKIKQCDEGSFEGLRALRELRMDDNGLKTLSNFGVLPRLRALHLSSNRVGELTELDKLRSLRHVVIINLSQNPVARKPLYRAHLINAVGSARAIDGKEVTDEERDRVEQMLQGNSGQPMGGAGCYVFTEQQAIPPQGSVAAYMHPSLAGGGEAGQRGVGQDTAAPRRGDPAARGQAGAGGVAQQGGHIMMSCHEDSGEGVKTIVSGGGRRHSVGGCGGGADGSGEAGGDGGRGGRRASAAGRQHSMPRSGR